MLKVRTRSGFPEYSRLPSCCRPILPLLRFRDVYTDIRSDFTSLRRHQSGGQSAGLSRVAADIKTAHPSGYNTYPDGCAVMAMTDITDTVVSPRFIDRGAPGRLPQPSKSISLPFSHRSRSLPMSFSPVIPWKPGGQEQYCPVQDRGRQYGQIVLSEELLCPGGGHVRIRKSAGADYVHGYPGIAKLFGHDRAHRFQRPPLTGRREAALFSSSSPRLWTHKRELPQPCPTMSGTNLLETRKKPVRLVSITALTADGDVIKAAVLGQRLHTRGVVADSRIIYQHTRGRSAS